MDSSGNSTMPAPSGMDELKNRKFQISFALIGGIGTVIWATQAHHKGRFWWYLGGSIIGGAIGMLIDKSTN